MILLYNIGLQLYKFSLYIASIFNVKAKQWVNGRKEQQLIRTNGSIWFHFASLGEFEQGRPVLEALRTLHPQKNIVITFFSPSGYEVRKGTPLANAVYYLPLDTAANAQRFINTIKPEMAVFTKYEYWYHYFNKLNKLNVPLYIISGIFRPKQVFFRWYGSLHRKILSFVTNFFLQDQQSAQLLQSIGLSNVTISGDTRFDRVWANAQHSKEIAGISGFKDGKKLFIAGSTWPQDEVLIAKLPAHYPDWKFIFAPHELSEEKIENLISLLPNGSVVKYSELKNGSKYSILIIDNIGMLSSVYAYGDLAYIGGGFGAGIHNTLEAAAFGLPVIFGPNYQKFNEARELISLKAGFSINNDEELKGIVDTLITDAAFYNITSKKITEYVNERIGATKVILDCIG